MATEPALGTRIKRARERKRWTQQELADALKVNIKTIDNWENSRTEPRSSIGALEDVLEVSLDGGEQAGPEYDDPDLQRVWDASEGLPDGARRELVRLADGMRAARRRGTGTGRPA